MKRKIIFVAVAALFAEGSLAQALPTGGTLTRGAGSIDTAGSAMTVTQTSQRAIFDFATYNIGAGASVTYAQPGASAVAVSRVPLSAGRSQIDGTLSANGHVMLLNPNGVLFGSSAVVNVGSLTASTGTINDDAFMAAATSIAVAGATTGSIENRGTITAGSAGLVAFVAPSVVNSGVITAVGGRIVLAGAQAATLSFNGGLYEIAVGQGVAGSSVANSGTLTTAAAATGAVAAGTVVLSAPEVEGVVTGAINLSGIQRANRVEVHGGNVVLSSDLDATTVTGSAGRIELHHGAQLQDAVAIAKSSGATVDVAGGQYTGEVTLGKANMTVSGRDGATLTVGEGQSGFTVDANNVTVEGMKVVGPYGQHYKDVNWDAAPGITAGVRIQGNRSGATIRNNDIRNLRQGVLMVENAPAASITGNTIDNTKGSILLRAEGATITGNKFDARGNEWDIVLLQNISAGAYFTSPHVSESAYGAGVMAMSAANGGMHILDRRFGSNGLLAPTPQFGNRSHIVVSQGASFTAADDFNLGNGLGNARQPLGFIADGINTVVHGGYVDVLAGTYVQTATLNVNKPVTLRGSGQAGPNATIIDARGVTGATGSYGMKVTADDVSLADFTFYGPTLDAGASYGIKVQPKDGAVGSRLRNFRITNVTSRGAGRAELDLHAVVGATIDGVTAIGTPVGAAAGTTTKGAGIQITDSEEVVIRNATTQDNAWGGVALYQANRFYDQQTKNIRVESSNTLHESNPLYLQDESASKDFAALNLQGFAYAVRNPATVGSVIQSQYTWMQKTTQGAYDQAVRVGSPAASYVQGWDGTALTQDFYVGIGNPTPSTSLAMSINSAIGAASAGATVHVGAGTFAEQLSINKSLILVGAGGDQTVVSPTSLAADASGMKNILTIGGGATTSVEVSGFLFKGPVPELNAGIFVRDNAYAHIHDNKLVDMRESASLSGNQRGQAIFVGRALIGTSGRALIEDNYIAGYQKGGIVVDGPGSQATITGNTVIGEGPTAATAQNGIQASRGASAHIEGNTVRGNSYTPGTDEATGILIYTPGANLAQGEITVGPNEVRENEVGIWTNDPRSLTRISLSGVSANERNAVAGFDGGYAGQGPLLEYPAWSAANAALVSAGAFGGRQSGDIVEAGGALKVTGWNAFAAIQPAVDAVAAGAGIDVASGTYAESVVLNGLRNLAFDGVTLGGLTINSGAAGSGIRGKVTASGPAGFLVDAPVYLLGDTSLATTGADIAFNADIQGFGGNAYALSLNAGSGNVMLLSGGAAGNPLGRLEVASNNFTLLGTLWVSGYDIDALGTVALSDSTLRSVGAGVAAEITAGGDVTGSTVSESAVAVDSGGSVLGSITAPSISVAAQESVSIVVNAPGPVEIHAEGPANVSGSAPTLVIDAPSGSASGDFGQVTNAGSGLIEVNGKPQVNATLERDANNSRVIPAEITTAASPQASGPQGGGKVRRRKAEDALDAFENGEAVEIDLTPG